MISGIDYPDVWVSWADCAPLGNCTSAAYVISINWVDQSPSIPYVGDDAYMRVYLSPPLVQTIAVRLVCLVGNIALSGATAYRTFS